MMLAALPGPTTFHEQLPWSIVHLSERAVVSNLSETIRRRRTQACLKALYYIPGAIRDVLAPYATGPHFCVHTFPLLNSEESLDLIEELWDRDNNDVSLSVRCVAAAISAFMINPPERYLKFLPRGVRFIGREDAGSDFLSRRFPMVENRENNDSARLQNIVLFLKDISAVISKIDSLWMRRDSEGSLLKDVRDERKTLYDSRHSTEYQFGTFKRHGNRTSPAFIPAVQHDLLALTLEIVTRGSVTDAAQVQRDAFQEVFSELEISVQPHPEGVLKRPPRFWSMRFAQWQRRLRISMPQPELEPLNLSFSGTASSSTTQGAVVEPEPEPRAGDEVTLGRLPLTFSRVVSSSALEGVTTVAPAPLTGSTISPTSRNEWSYPPHPSISSSEHAARDPTTFA
jgi:hypothetical protein